MKKTVALPKPKDLVVHPLIMATFPILTLYFQNMGKGFLRQAALMAAGGLAFAILAWLVLYLLIKDKNRSAIIVSVPAACAYLDPGPGRNTARSKVDESA